MAQASWKNIVVSEEELILFHRSRARELSLQGKGLKIVREIYSLAFDRTYRIGAERRKGGGGEEDS